jgi:hypothetical protein
MEHGVAPANTTGNINKWHSVAKKKKRLAVGIGIFYPPPHTPPLPRDLRNAQQRKLQTDVITMRKYRK